MGSAPAKWTHFTDSLVEAQNRQRNGKRTRRGMRKLFISVKLIFVVCSIDIGVYRTCPLASDRLWNPLLAPSASGPGPALHLYRLLQLSVCLSVTVWLFPIHLRDVREISIPVNIGERDGRGGRKGGGASPQNAPSSNFSPSALIVLQLSLFSSTVHLTANIITGLDRTSLNSFLCSV